MTRTLTLVILSLTVSLASIANAGQQIGVFGLQGFTNSDRLTSPSGFGLFLQKDLSKRVALRFSYQEGQDADRYESTIRTTFWPIDPGDTIRDLWNQSSSMNCYDLSVLVSPFAAGVTTVQIGAGLGIVNLEYSAVGWRTGYEFGGDSRYRMALSLIANFKLEYPPILPITLHLWVRERVSPSNEASATDSATYFGDTVTSAEIALALGFRF